MIDILVPVSPGELIDKITILQLKSQRIDAPAKLVHVRTELEHLERVARGHLPNMPELSALWRELEKLNAALWDIEDALHLCEVESEFGPRFVELARQVYLTNDQRAAVKAKIDILLGAGFVSQKSYVQGKP